MMGAPAGLAKHVARVQTVLGLGDFYPPKGQLAMLMKGMMGAESGFAPLMFQRVVGVEDRAKDIAAKQVDAVDGGNAARHGRRPRQREWREEQG